MSGHRENPPLLTYSTDPRTLPGNAGSRRVDRPTRHSATNRSEDTMEPKLTMGTGHGWQYEARMMGVVQPYHGSEWAQGYYRAQGSEMYMYPSEYSVRPRSELLGYSGSSRVSGSSPVSYSTSSESSYGDYRTDRSALPSSSSSGATSSASSYLPATHRAYQHASELHHYGYAESHVQVPGGSTKELYSPVDQFLSHGSTYSSSSEDYSHTPSLPGSEVDTLAELTEHQMHIQQRNDFPPHPISDISEEGGQQEGVSKDENPIEITLQPVECIVGLKARAQFQCGARIKAARGEPSFLWYKDSEPLVGEINEEYVIDEATGQDAGLYFCLVSDSDEKYFKKTDDARLIVRTEEEPSRKEPGRPSPPEIVVQPEAYVEAVAGERLRLSLEVAGTPPLDYIWYKDTKELRYATANVLEIPNANQLDTGQYCCSVSNPYGSILSDPFQVKVRRGTAGNVPQARKPVIRSKSSDYSVPQYRQQSWDDQPMTDRFLKEVAVQLAKQTTNWSRIAIFFGLSNTEVATSQIYYPKPEDQAYQILKTWKAKRNGDRSKLLTILSQAGIDLSALDPYAPSTTGKPARKPVVCVQPRDQRVIYGQTARLIIEVDNPDYSTSYQWYRNGEAMHGKASPELLVHSTIDSDNGEYFCKVTNRGGSVSSDVARIRVVYLASGRDRQPHTPLRPDLWRFMQSQLQSRGSEEEEGGEAEGGVLRGLLHRGPPTITAKASQPRQGIRTAAGTSRGEKPKIVKQPQPQVVDAGDPLTLTCQASTTVDLTYLWYFNGLSLKGETRPEYSINCFTDEDEGMYQCEVANSHGRVMSDMVEVKMKAIDSSD